MSGYRGRAGPNFSEFLNNLNAVSPSYDQEQFNTDDINLDEELAMFTNTDFTHFDIPSIPDAGTANFDLDDNPTANDNIKYEELLAGTTPPSVLIGTSAAEPVPLFPNYNTPIQPAPPANAFTVNPQRRPSSVTPSAASPQTQPAKKRKADAVSPAVSTEEQSRLAAEEDKRRRNTAASARFRVKKKQREATLERTVKEVNDKNAQLQAKVSQLEMENKWLKDLIVEKNGNQSKEEIAEAFQQFRRESEERETESSGVKTGVGTAS
jgi:Basic region leucine zipper